MFKVLIARRELIHTLVSRELKSRYKGSALGFLWSLLTPLFMAVIYIFFFRMLIGRGVPTEGIIIGVFAWNYTMHSMNTGMQSVSGNSNLVKKVMFPRFLLPFSVTMSGLVDFLISIGIQLVLVGALLYLKGSMVSGWAVLLPLAILYHTMFNFSLALVTSASHVYFRDTQHLVNVFVSAWFFMSPIMYDLEFVRTRAGEYAWVADWFMLNPLSVIITAYRSLMLPDTVFAWNIFSIIGVLLPLAFFAFATLYFQRLQRNFADYV